jgi:hypothetical protein
MPADPFRRAAKVLAERERRRLRPCPSAATLDTYLGYRSEIECQECFRDHLALCPSCALLVLIRNDPSLNVLRAGNRIDDMNEVQDVITNILPNV